MAQIKKNQLANIIFPMVDKTDFATLETGITASNFNSAGTKKFFGVTHGNSTAFTSGTISKATTLVRSGIFQQTLKASEDNYDYLMVRFTHPSCADQLLVFQPVDYDDSDIFSFLSDIGSDLRSYLIGMSGMLSDVYSNVSDFYSDFQSRVPKRVATDSQLSDLHSDLKSFLTGLSGLVSDIDSALTSQFAYLSNAISDAHSDLRSQISGITVTVTASDMSDIASRVWATAEGTRVDSRILVIQSLVSDVDSQLLLNASMISDVQSALDSQFAYLSNAISDAHSDLRSQISGITVTVTASDMSDIASRVWATAEGTRVDSRILVIQSLVSDVDSQLLLNASMISDVQSALDSQFAILTSNISDIDSQLLLNASMISDVYSLVSDLNSDFDSKIGSALTSIVTRISQIDSGVDRLQQAHIAQIGSVASTVADASVVEIDGIDHDSEFNGQYIRILGGSQVNELRLIVNTDKTASKITVKPAFNSRLLSGVNYIIYDGNPLQSQLFDLTSDVDSQLLLNASMISDVQSALDSQFLVLTSNISDIDSQLLLNASMISDVQSALDSQFAYLSNAISDAHSDLRSQISGITVTVTASDMSDIASRVWATAEGTRVDSRILVIQSLVSDVDSQLLLNASMISDVYSLLSDHHSDFQSRVNKQVANFSQLSDVHSDLRSQIAGITASVSASDISDIASAVWAAKYGTHSLASSFGSLFSDVYSRIVLIQSNVSDVESQIDAGVSISASDMSDIRSAIAAGPAATVTASDISDIASAVWAAKYGTHSLASSFGSLFSDVYSRILLIQSNVSDVESQLDLTASVVSDVQSALDSQFAYLSNAISDAHSDLRSQISGITVTVTASDMSDIASRVWATAEGTRVDSRIRLIQSNVSDVESQLDLTASVVSDIYSLLSDHDSNMQSRVDKRVANFSQLSDIHSDLRSYVVGLSGMISDIESQLDLTASVVSDIESQLDLTASVVSDVQSALDSQFLVLTSNISDIDSQLLLNASVISDVQSLVDARLPAALISGRMNADMTAISGSATDADKLELSVGTIVSGTAQAGTLSTTQMTTDLTEATNDHYIGRVIIWTSGALKDQATDITDYAGSGGLLTFTAVTEAPTAGDTFIIV